MSNKLEGITLQAEGEANCYRMMRGGNWLASIRMNGELLVWDQEAILNAMLSSGKPAADPVQDIARQLGIQTFGDGLLAKIRQTVDLLQEAAAERDQLRAEVERLKAQLAEEIQRRFDGNKISSNEHREEVQRLQAQLAQQQGVPGAAVCTTDCRSPDGISVGIIDAMITLARLFKGAEVTPAVAEALLDLRSDEDLISMLASPAPGTGQQASPWVAVTERLPQIKQVLSEKCTLEGREIPTLYRSGMVLTFDGSRVSAGIVEWFHSKYPLNNVTHWMPLPAAPEVAP